MRFFLCLFYMFHHRYSNCRPLNSARFNHIICQTIENTSFLQRLSCILHALAKGYQGYKSNFGFSCSFQPRNLANLGSKIRFWIRWKEHTLNDLRDNQWVGYLPSYFCSHYRVVDFLSIPPPGIYHPKRRKMLTPGVYPGEAWAHLELTDA